jgi:hypothetical protein
VMPWYCNKYGINSCGGDLPDRMAHKVSFTRPHNDTAFTIEISSTLEKPACQASWGIDDFHVFLM